MTARDDFRQLAAWIMALGKKDWLRIVFELLK